MRFDYDRSIYPEPNIPADERQDAIRCLGRAVKRNVKDDADADADPLKHIDTDQDEDVDPDSIHPHDFETREAYEDALEEAGIDPEEAMEWEEPEANY